MCANVNVYEPTSSSSSPPAAQLSPPSAPRSLLSRLSSLSPLRSRARNLVDFHIRPLEPYRKYSPGDLVRGAVVLTVVKPVRITHLTVALHGFVRVFKNGQTADTTAIDAGTFLSGSSSKAQLVGSGHASLFQDEVTLCGEGRLDVGVYEFNFELEFPKKGLPTSIDFERGTISYNLRATITRPTSISATATCDRKLSLVETVDIGPLRPLKPRTISLEPISKRHKMKRRSSKATTIQSPSTTTTPEDSSSYDGTQGPSSPHPDDNASFAESAARSVASHTTPNSPVASEGQSEVSAESVVSSESTGRSVRIGPAPSFRSAPESHGTSSRASVSDKTITATVEMLKPGCLPGDTLQLRISIQHTKPIRSMHGVIITLFRQSRIDSSPPLSLFVDIKGKAAERMKHEDYYPKSKTGLGGLSLSSAGSSSVFRKDLSQTFAPLIIDPTTLSTVVTASIRVPADVFPTISGVPGHMISFKYYVEVVLDLGGKLASQESFLPKIGMVSMPSTNYGGNGTQSIGHQDERLPNIVSSWNGTIVDTDHIRREKSVIACVIEVIVGTKDSARNRGKGAKVVQSAAQDDSSNPDAQRESDQARPEESSSSHLYAEKPPYEENQHPRYPPYHEFDTYDSPPPHEFHALAQRNLHYHEQVPIYVPTPEVSAERSLTDKERVAQAEQRLLPSQPPQAEAESLGVSRQVAPSAPLDLGDLYSASDSGPHHNGSTAGPSAPPVHDIITNGESSAPPAEYFDFNGTTAVDDKLELERQRLLAEASAPPDFPEDDREPTPRSETLPPTAPLFDEDEEFEYSREQYHTQHGLPDDLPAYQR